MRASVGLLILASIPLPIHQQAQAQDTAKKTAGGVIVVNSDGKEYTLKNWKIVLGARTLKLSSDAVKAPAKGEKAEPAKSDGPEYLEMREDNSTTYQEGILTLVPINSIRRIDYDEPKKSVAVTMVQADGMDVVLTGTTKYNGINKLTLEGEIEAPGLDSARVRVQGGMPKAKPAVKSFRFTHEPQPPGKPAGPAVLITAVGKDKTQFKVQDIKSLYKIAGQDRVSGKLLFKKQAKIDLGKIVTMKHVQLDPKKASLDFEVALSDGMQFIFTLIKDTYPDDNTPGQFVGLIGMAPQGYRLFPAHTIRELRKEE